MQLVKEKLTISLDGIKVPSKNISQIKIDCNNIIFSMTQMSPYVILFSDKTCGENTYDGNRSL